MTNEETLLFLGNKRLDYFMESARVRYLRTSFPMQKQRVRKYRTKHFPCCNLFILYLIRFSHSTRFAPFIRQNKCQVIFLFRLSASTLSLLQKPSVNTFGTECLPSRQSTLQVRLICFPCLAFFKVVCFKLPDISLLGKTLCRR